MKKIIFTTFCLVVATILAGGLPVFALDGEIVIHDPSTVILCNGKYYTYGTGGISLFSDDGWTWRRGPSLPRRGVAPDVIHIGDRYFLYIAANSGPTKADINLLTNRTLDPDSPDYKWEEGVSWHPLMELRIAMRLIQESSSIQLPADCGSHTAPTSVTSGW